MKTQLKSRTAILVGGALTAFLAPKLAKDKKLDVVPFLKDLTLKNYKVEMPKIAKLVMDAALPMMMPEQKEAMSGPKGPDDVIHMLASHIIGGGGEAPTEEAIKEDEIPAMEEPSNDNAALMEFLKSCGLDDTQLANAEKMLKGETGDDEEDDEDEDDPVLDTEEGKEPVTKKTMDKALAKVAADTADRVRKEMTETAEAREFVRPWVGSVSMAHDSATKVFQATLATLGVDAKGITDAKALKLLIEAKPKIGDNTARANDRVVPAMDSSVEADLAKRFPHAANITIN